MEVTPASASNITFQQNLMSGAVAVFNQFTKGCPSLQQNSDVVNIIQSMSDLASNGTDNIYTDSQTINQAFSDLERSLYAGTPVVNDSDYFSALNGVADSAYQSLDSVTYLSTTDWTTKSQALCANTYGTMLTLQCFPEIQNFPNADQVTKLTQDIFQLLGGQGIAQGIQDLTNDLSGFINSGGFQGLVS